VGKMGLREANQRNEGRALVAGFVLVPANNPLSAAASTLRSGGCHGGRVGEGGSNPKIQQSLPCAPSTINSPTINYLQSR
jgi:hypothetical protein